MEKFAIAIQFVLFVFCRAAIAGESPLSLTQLPCEIQSHIISFLDVVDNVSFGKTSDVSKNLVYTSQGQNFPKALEMVPFIYKKGKEKFLSLYPKNSRILNFLQSHYRNQNAVSFPIEIQQEAVEKILRFATSLSRRPFLNIEMPMSTYMTQAKEWAWLSPHLKTLTVEMQKDSKPETQIINFSHVIQPDQSFKPIFKTNSNQYYKCQGSVKEIEALLESNHDYPLVGLDLGISSSREQFLNKLIASSFCKTLTQLDLSYSRVTPENIDSLVDLTALKTLSLKGNFIGIGKNVALMNYLSKAPDLNYLGLADNYLNFNQLSALVELPVFSTLKTLDISQNCFDYKNFKIFEKTPLLTYLDLSQTIYPENMQPLIGLEGLKNLTHMNLAGNYLTVQDLESFSQSLYTTNIQSLNLSENFVGLSGLRVLLNQNSQLHSLKHLELFHSAVPLVIAERIVNHSTYNNAIVLKGLTTVPQWLGQMSSFQIESLKRSFENFMMWAIDHPIKFAVTVGLFSFVFVTPIVFSILRPSVWKQLFKEISELV